MDAKLTHLDESGRAKMVDVGDKPVTRREAIAEGVISLQAETLRAITAGTVPKGDVFSTARIAGIMAAKRCGEMIPLCHPLPIESIEVDFEIQPGRVRIQAIVRRSKGRISDAGLHPAFGTTMAANPAHQRASTVMARSV